MLFRYAHDATVRSYHLGNGNHRPMTRDGIGVAKGWREGRRLSSFSIILSVKCAVNDGAQLHRFPSRRPRRDHPFHADETSFVMVLLCRRQEPYKQSRNLSQMTEAKQYV